MKEFALKHPIITFLLGYTLISEVMEQSGRLRREGQKPTLQRR